MKKMNEKFCSSKKKMRSEDFYKGNKKKNENFP